MIQVIDGAGVRAHRGIAGVDGRAAGQQGDGLGGTAVTAVITEGADERVGA